MFDLAAVGASLALKPALDFVLNQLEGTAEGVTKDWLGTRAKALLKPNALKRAVQQAATAFVHEFEVELVTSGESDHSCKAYKSALERFLSNQTVVKELGRAVVEVGQPNSGVDPNTLQIAWGTDRRDQVPAEFSWPKMVRRYERQARQLVLRDAELRIGLESTERERQLVAAERQYGLPASFDVEGLAARLRQSFMAVKLDAIDQSTDHATVSFRKVFVEPYLRFADSSASRLAELPIEGRPGVGFRTSEAEAREHPDARDTDRRLLDIDRQHYFLQPVVTTLDILEFASRPIRVRQRVCLTCRMRHPGRIRPAGAALEARGRGQGFASPGFARP